MTTRYLVKLAWVTGILLLLLLPTACNQGNGEQLTASPTPVVSTSVETAVDPETVAPSAEPAAEPLTREYEHELGKVEIPVHPKRVVSIQYTGAMLALGVKPVGADDEWSVYPLLAEEWAGIEDVGDPWTGLNLEKIVSLEPDLIVTHVEATYESLSQIAPTLFIPWLKYDVRQQIAEFGDILGKQAEATEWLREFDAKVQSAKLKAAEWISTDETVAIVNIRPKNQFVYGNSAMGGYVIYQALGLKAPEFVQTQIIDKKLAALEISLETLPEYAAADHLFVSVLEADGGAERADEITSGRVWSNLPAAKNNRVYPLEWNTYFTTDPISISKQIDTFLELLSQVKQ